MRALHILRERAEILVICRGYAYDGSIAAFAVQAGLTARKCGNYVEFVQRADLQRRAVPLLVAHFAFDNVIRLRTQTFQAHAVQILILVGNFGGYGFF